MKKRVLMISVVILTLIIIGVIIIILTRDKNVIDVKLEDHACKNTPLSENCLVIKEGPVYDNTVNYGVESVFNETFSEDYVNSQPFSWLLFRNDTYKMGAVAAKVLKDDQDNKYVSLYSNGIHGPRYNPLDRSLIFTREFNLEEKGYGVVEADLMIPSTQNNEVFFEVTTGAVNVLGINIKKDGKVSVISGGVYHNYQGTVDVTNPNVTLTNDKWYTFRLEWNREEDTVKASMYDETGNLVTLYEGAFHISVRESAKREGDPIAPNVVRFSMPKLVDRNGYVYIDNIHVDAVIGSEE